MLNICWYLFQVWQADNLWMSEEILCYIYQFRSVFHSIRSGNNIHTWRWGRRTSSRRFLGRKWFVYNLGNVSEDETRQLIRGEYMNMLSMAWVPLHKQDVMMHTISHGAELGQEDLPMLVYVNLITCWCCPQLQDY